MDWYSIPLNTVEQYFLLRITIYYFRLALATTAADWYLFLWFGTATADYHLLLLDATSYYAIVIATVNYI